MLDIFGTRRIAQLQEALRVLDTECARLERERNAARAQRDRLNQERHDLNATIHRLSAEVTRLLDEREQYAVKRPRARGVRVKQVDGQTIAEQVE